MPAAARIGDPTSHTPALPSVPGMPAPPPVRTGVLAPAPRGGLPTVLINMRPAAVVGAVNACTVPPQHALLGPGNVVLPSPAGLGSVVLIGGVPAARVGDRTTCQATVAGGSPDVFIGGVG
ncbi:PAAR domain-containing protein [Actinoalloteichus hymeniacidonis]|uniref:PAAR motif protein n=1 Tax=Actinoalloteichus hymeniacidonis TaxID=340345 RepID=A0AAC9HRJ0_9PSEU|nr:PAAR domain-containing protein [Actinoalloteichus hymeniacidonis]AOS64294.1 hypothetical protein TL08_17470 [Actinoalloteichus hymeniacidonis]MBB5907638.1 putative Zn-binding protein involved in type VI secretion [Actinoalloteichus hymeniacidonis]